MSTYKSYDGVARLQEVLEAEKDGDKVTFSLPSGKSTLKSSDGSYDGKLGPDTESAFWSWLETQPPGSDLQTLVDNGKISPADADDVTQALHEFYLVDQTPPKEPSDDDGSWQDKPPPGSAPGAGTTGGGKGLSTWAWLGIGALAAGAIALGWHVYKTRYAGGRQLRPAHAAAHGLDGFGEPAGELGCGCEG